MLPLHKPLSVSTIIRLLTESTSNPNFALDKAESTPTTGPTSSPGYASTTSYGPITTAHPSGNTGGGGGAHTSTSTNVGAIVGGVVGGVIGLALVALLAIFLFRHRNSDRVAPSYFANTSQYSNPNPFVDGSMMETSFPGSPTRLSVRSTFWFVLGDSRVHWPWLFRIRGIPPLPLHRRTREQPADLKAVN